MTKLLVTCSLVLLALAPAAQAGDSCVPDAIPQLVPVTPARVEHAAGQDELCKEILRDQAKCTNDRVKSAVAFCTSPLTLTVPVVAAEELVTVADHLANACKPFPPGAVTIQSSAFAVPMSLQNDLIQGLAQFVVARAKAEAMAFLITRIGDKICKGDEGKAMLPKTCSLVAASKPEDGAPMAWGTLKAAFELDLVELPERAMACVSAKQDVSPDAASFLLTTVQIIQHVRRGTEPIALLEGLTDRFPAPKCDTNQLECFLHMVGYTIRTATPTVDPATGDDESPGDPARTKAILVRRVYERAKQLGLVSAATNDQLKKMQTDIEALIQAFRAVRTEYNAQKAKILDASLPIVDRLKAAAPVLEKVIAFVKLAHGLMPGDFEGTAPAATTAAVGNAAVSKAADTKDKKHELTKKEIFKALLSVASELKDAVDAARVHNYSLMFVHLTAAVGVLKRAGIVEKIPASLEKFGPFMADVASAKDADEVQRALETAATPVGGGLAKRGKGQRTIALNAFLGIQAGAEFVEAPDGTNTYGRQMSLFAPIGIDASWGICNSASVGVFASVIDLGAVTTIRNEESLANDQKIETTPEIGFAQVFSPGLYFVLGIDRLAIGAGVSMTPELRKISDDFMVVEEAPALRFGAFAAIDVTIFPF